MKYKKYNLLIIILAIIPFVFIGTLLTASLVKDFNLTATAYALIILVTAPCLVGIKILAKKSADVRAQEEYDEFGLKKNQTRYDLSKSQRQALDIQQVANLERIISRASLDKMVKKGSETPVKDLNNLIGLTEVKHVIQEMAARMAFESKDTHRKNAFSARHMVFFGPPGTGKTTVARIITGFLFKYGYIRENKIIEIDGNFLKATNASDTAIKVRYIISKAYGGVLFIDEAYSLIDPVGCGPEAIATLIKEMEDNKDKFIVILAGYARLMKEMLELNPGFESRIKDYLYFSDYKTNEMWEIFKNMAHDNKYNVDKSVKPRFVKRIEAERRLNTFGNARTVRNVLDGALDKHALNYMKHKIAPENKYRLMDIDIRETPNKGTSQINKDDNI